MDELQGDVISGLITNLHKIFSFLFYYFNTYLKMQVFIRIQSFQKTNSDSKIICCKILNRDPEEILKQSTLCC